MNPYDRPNPYGSFFTAGGPEGAARDSFLPDTGNLDPSVMAMMGAPVGGFSPTSGEYWAERARRKHQLDYMSYVMRNDPRSSVFSNLASQALFGNDTRLRNRTIRHFGGQDSFNDLIGFMLNQPGVSGYLGGSMRSIGVGSMAVTTSGMRVNGVGIPGYGPIQDVAARQLFSNLTNQFYTRSGAEITSMTQGLNRDQIGGVLALGASQGAFSGLDLGKLTRAVNGQHTFELNQITAQKITDFTKSAAKALSTLIDVYGNADVGTLMRKAQSITGLDASRMENMATINSRLVNLRRAGSAAGIDAMSMFDTAAGATAMMQRMGMGGSMAGYIGQFASIESSQAVLARRAAAGQFFMAPISRQELAAGTARDMFAMVNDPAGASRAAVELMIQNGTIRPEQVAGIRARMNAAGPGRMAGIDTIVPGMSLTRYIQAMGGPMAMAEQLDESHRGALTSANRADLSRRHLPLIRRRAETFFGRGLAGSAANITNALNTETIMALTQAADRGASTAELRSILMEQVNNGFVRVDQVDGIINQISQIRGGLGRPMTGTFRDLSMAMANDPLLRQHISEQQQRESMDAITRTKISAGDRGVMSRGFTREIMEGMLNRLGATDPVSRLAVLAFNSHGKYVAGLDPTETLRIQRGAHLRNGHVDSRSVTQMLLSMHKQFRRMGAVGENAMRTLLGDDALAGILAGKTLTEGTAEEMLTRLNSPEIANQIFSNFEIFQGSDRRGAFQMFASRPHMEQTPFQIAAQGGQAFADSLRRSMGSWAFSGDSRAGAMVKLVRDLTGANGQLSRGELERRQARLEKFIGDTSLIQQMSTSDFAHLVDKNRNVAGMMAKALVERKSQLESDKTVSDRDKGGEIKDIDKRLEILEQKGVPKPDSAKKVTEIFGQLRVIGGDRLEFLNAGMTNR